MDNFLLSKKDENLLEHSVNLRQFTPFIPKIMENKTQKGYYQITLTMIFQKHHPLILKILDSSPLIKNSRGVFFIFSIQKFCAKMKIVGIISRTLYHKGGIH